MRSVSDQARDAEPFAAEIALALDDIEALTRDECAGIRYLGQIKRVEPILAFLSLHVKLAFVLSSRHGKGFCESLRAWDANASIERKLAHHWPRYRANWKRGRALDAETIEALSRNPVASWLIGVRSTAAANTKRESWRAACQPQAISRSRVLDQFAPGTTFRLRFPAWDSWEEWDVVRLSTRGNFWCVRRGSGSTTRPQRWMRDLLSRPDCAIEIVSQRVGHDADGPVTEKEG